MCAKLPIRLSRKRGRYVLARRHRQRAGPWSRNPFNRMISSWNSLGATSVTRGALLLAVASTAVAIGAQPANAGFRVCNQFERRVDVAFGYVDRQQGWMAQGWYIIEPSACKDVHRADLDNRYYYLFIRSSRDATWTGDVPFCIQE